jgi:UDP-N-acetylglucosamine--N-acetylmuramyl-(pentapeptide) pyrophosphoryl-undecaprenol N-acetylglucosamine transferase
MPGRNLAAWLKKDDPSHEALFLTAGRPVEDRFFEKERWPRETLFPGYVSRPSPLNPLPWIRAAARARKALRRFAPDALVVLGGYASLPVLLASRPRPRPMYVLEVNAVSGRSTRLAAAFARRVFCHFEETVEAMPRNTLLTGSPLAPGFGSSAEAPAALREAFGLDPNLPTLLVAGGSQGAKAINDFVLDHLPLLAGARGQGVQVLHVAGPRDFDRVRAGYGAADFRHAVVPFVDPMERAYRAADLILCRGGAMTVAEVAACGLPSVIVPYPHHKDRHQFHNARGLRQAGGAVILEEKDFSDRTFQESLVDLLHDPARRKALAEGARRAGRADGGKRILDRIKADLGE